MHETNPVLKKELKKGVKTITNEIRGVTKKIYGNKFLSEIVEELFSENELEELFSENGIEAERRYNTLLRRWIIDNSELFKSVITKKYSSFPDNPLIIKDRELTVPDGKIEILKVINDGKLTRDMLNQEIELKISRLKEQHSASCFNFANGGKRYNFKLDYKGIKTSKSGKPFDHYRVLFQVIDPERINDEAEAGWVEYSQGEFHTFKYEAEGEFKTFAEEGITITRVAASDNRVFCYGYNKEGEETMHRFFWSQMEDSFPDEPGGISLPGVYVAIPPNQVEENKRFRDIKDLYEDQYKKHPAWLLQTFGAKLEEILGIIDESNGFNLLTELLSEKGNKIVKLLEDNISEFGEDQKIVLEKIKEALKEEFKTQEFTNNMPVIVKKGKWYEIGINGKNLETEKEIKIKEVYDIGVADIERYENYKTEHGGEIQCWIYDAKLEEFSFSIKPKLRLKQVLSKILNPIEFFTIFVSNKVNAELNNELVDFLTRYYMPNFTVVDGMGFNDGTCNFFVLAKIELTEQGKAEQGKSEQVMTVLWCDEQEAFSECWRQLDPKDRIFKGKIGMLSVFSAIDWYYGKDKLRMGMKVYELFNKWDILGVLFSALYSLENQPIFKFFENYKMPYDQIDEYSRLAVSRLPVLLTTKDRIHSVSSMWGVTDFTWTKRAYPKEQIVFPQTIQARDDTTIYLMGLCQRDGAYLKGYYYQKYLPQSILQNHFAKKHYSNEPFSHVWHFVKEDIFEKMDRYYNFGIYDAYDEINKDNRGYFPFNKKELIEKRNHYAFHGLDDRTQYYKIYPIGEIPRKFDKEEFEDEFVKKLNNPQDEKFIRSLYSYQGYVNEYHLKPELNLVEREMLEKIFIKIKYKTKESIKKIKEMIFDGPLLWSPIRQSDECMPIHPFYSSYMTEEPNRSELLAIKIALRWDNVDEILIAVYAHPRDDDIGIDMENDETITEHLPAEWVKALDDMINELNKAYDQLDKNGNVKKESDKLKLIEIEIEKIKTMVKANIDHNIERKVEMINNLIKDVQIKINEINKNMKETTLNLKQNTPPTVNKIIDALDIHQMPKYSFVNPDLTGRWSCMYKEKRVEYIFKFEERVKDFSPPAVKTAVLKKEDGQKVKVTLTSKDDRIRYVTIGAVIGNAARRISVRYPLSKEELKKKEFSVPLLPMGNDDKYFQKDSHIHYGTSIWFEDILGHKSTPEELELG